MRHSSGLRSAWLTGLLLAVALTAAGAAVAQEATEARLAGRWTAADTSAAERSRDAAIDRATEDMSILTRGIARRRLRDSIPIHRTLQFSGEGESFRAVIGGYVLDFAPDGSSHRITDPFDEELQAKQRFRHGKLVQTMVADGATLTHTVELAEGGDRLTLTVKVASHHLPGDVVFRVPYRRR